MVLDSDLRLTLANPGADRIIGVTLAGFIGRPLAELPRVGELAAEIRTAFNEQVAAGAASWQRQFALARTASQAEAPAGAVPAATDQTLLARGSILPERRVGYVIVFDDISEVISAQRAVAWAEVARRLAHEITNPLTPIQLAAERMRAKLRDKLAGSDAELLEKNAQTIVNQVAALKTMVDEFRDYARLPAARLEALSLNALIEDVLRLYSAPEVHGAIRFEAARPLPPVLGDATQLRQVIHNLLKNALEAAEKTKRPEIFVGTETVELADGAPAVRLQVRDNGTGFAPAMLARAFEPYVTSKSRGTGLGLAIVRKITDEHQARIDLTNWTDAEGRTAGALVSILFTRLAKNSENPPLVVAAQRRDEANG
jgi:nitrogen fixation/metabolism regulation signal transduction histidine kinase